MFGTLTLIGAVVVVVVVDVGVVEEVRGVVTALVEAGFMLRWRSAAGAADVCALPNRTITSTVTAARKNIAASTEASPTGFAPIPDCSPVRQTGNHPLRWKRRFVRLRVVQRSASQR